MVVRDLRQLTAERALAGADDAPPCGDAVGLRDRRRLAEGAAKLLLLAAEVRVERQLLRHEQRRDQHDARAAVGGKAAGEIEGVLGLGTAEQRDDDVPVADGDGAAGQTLRAPADGQEVGPPHRSSW